MAWPGVSSVPHLKHLSDCCRERTMPTSSPIYCREQPGLQSARKMGFTCQISEQSRNNEKNQKLQGAMLWKREVKIANKRESSLEPGAARGRKFSLQAQNSDRSSDPSFDVLGSDGGCRSHVHHGKPRMVQRPSRNKVKNTWPA